MVKPPDLLIYFPLNYRNSMKKIPRIAVFASGNGSNAQRIAEYFVGTGLLEISAIYCNNPDAFVLHRAKSLEIPSILFNKDTFYNSTTVLEDLNSRETDWIVLAGFLWLIPDYILKAFPNRIINIHPALLPSFPGLHAQKQAIDYGSKYSGCTVHFVDSEVDTGPIILQAIVKIKKEDTEKTLSKRILKKEHQIYPEVIRLFAEKKIEVLGRKTIIS